MSWHWASLFRFHPKNFALSTLPVAVATGLVCEYLTNPLGLGERSPRLSWRLADDRPGALQTAWKIVAASSPEKLEHCPDLWDSGRIEDSRTLDIEYAGKPLASRRTVWWKVLVWDHRVREGSWSEPACFEMGLLRKSEYPSWNDSILQGATTMWERWNSYTRDKSLIRRQIVLREISRLIQPQARFSDGHDNYVGTMRVSPKRFRVIPCQKHTFLADGSRFRRKYRYFSTWHARCFETAQVKQPNQAVPSGGAKGIPP